MEKDARRYGAVHILPIIEAVRQRAIGLVFFGRAATYSRPVTDRDRDEQIKQLELGRSVIIVTDQATVGATSHGPDAFDPLMLERWVGAASRIAVHAADLHP